MTFPGTLHRGTDRAEAPLPPSGRNAARAGVRTHSVSLITSLFVCLGLAPSLGLRAGGFSPLSGGMTTCEMLWNAPQQAERLERRSCHPSAAQWCSEGRKVPTATGHLFPTKMPALDLQGSNA